MKKLFGTSALVMAMALPAFAQDTTTTMPADTAMTAPSPYLEGVDRGVRASDFLGKRVYVTEQDTSAMSTDAIAEANTDWEDAGEISDLIISLNGDSEAVLVDFGGFLGIGEKTVAVSMANLVMVPDSNSPDDYFLVFNGSKAALEGAPEFNEDMVFEAAAETTAADGMATTAPAGDMTTTAPAGDMTATDPAMVPADPNATAPAATDGMAATDGTAATDGMAATDMSNEMADLTVMTEADLVGKRVVGPNDEDVGEVSAVAVGADGVITGAVVDVGGFLGIGEKRVSLGSDALGIVRTADGMVDYFRVTMTQEQLETLPVYAN